MSEELSDIQKLIRLKRYEQPPEDYFEDFLLDFQRRQRAEMLQRPVWQIAWERANLWLAGFRVPTIAYASIVVAAIGVTGLIVQSQGGGSSAPTMAAAGTGKSIDAISSAPTGQVMPVSTGTQSSNYILEKRPVSYDAPFSF